MNKFLKASRNPIDDINAIAYEGQPLEMRMYKQGYEADFEMLPVLEDDDPFLDYKLKQSAAAMSNLASKLYLDPWTESLKPLDGKFNRTILGMESPYINANGRYKEGKEVVLARWGDGFSSPVHGHADGLLYEQLIFGTMRVNTYRITNYEERRVRPVATEIFSNFKTIANSYTYAQSRPRTALVHNFTSIGYSASLHYVPEHTRDGRDNQFKVEYFDFNHQFLPAQYFTQLNAQQGLEQLRPGDVALVRSENVPEYGDHWIVITGLPILKEHGLRPQEVAIHAPYAGNILSQFQPIMGLTLLKLSDNWAKKFREFHGIVLDGKNVILPNA